MSEYQYETNDLFKYAEPWKLNACIGRNGGPYTFHAYSLGYFAAAKVLITAAIDKKTTLDLAIYPIVYNYRHAIELGLKHLYDVLPEIWDEEPTPIPATHKLIDVWARVRPYLLRHQDFDDKNGSTILFINKVLDDIVQFDPRAEVFRFPADRGGNFYLQESAYINIRILEETLEEVRQIFEIWFTIAHVLKQGKSHG